MAAKNEQNKLNFLAMNHCMVKTKVYQRLRDMVAADKGVGVVDIVVMYHS